VLGRSSVWGGGGGGCQNFVCISALRAICPFVTYSLTGLFSLHCSNKLNSRLVEFSLASILLRKVKVFLDVMLCR